MAKFALKKMQFLAEAAFLRCNFGGFREEGSLGVLGALGEKDGRLLFFETIFLRLLFGDSLYGWGESVWACSCCCWDFWAASFFL